MIIVHHLQKLMLINELGNSDRVSDKNKVKDKESWGKNRKIKLCTLCLTRTFSDALTLPMSAKIASD